MYSDVVKIAQYLKRKIWAASWQNQQSDCAPSEDSDQPEESFGP